MTNDSSLMMGTESAQHYTPDQSRPSPAQVLVPLSRVSAQAGLQPLSQRLSDVRAWLEGDLQQLESELHDLVQAQSDGDLARRAAGHLLQRPGKRVRPLCVMLGAQLVDLPVDDRIRNLAIAGELVHAATLLHDDVIDEAVDRRGAAAARVVYSNSASILGGDYLLVEALERVTSATWPTDGGPGQGPLLLKSMLDTISRMVAAEALQLEQRTRFVPSREAYLQVIEGKTASLFRWALCAGPMLTGRSTSLTALAAAGTALGMAFQLVDDLLDLEGDAEETGKDLFADLLQGKLTWPLILAAEHDPTLTEDVRRLSAEAARDELNDATAASIVRRIKACGALDQTRLFANQQRQSAHQALTQLPPSPAREAIRVVVDATVERRK